MAFLATSSDFLSRTYRYLREPSASPSYWPSAQIIDYLDEAHARVIRDFWLTRAEWWTNTSAAAGAGNSQDGVYTLPADCLVPRHVLYTDATNNGVYAALGRKGVNDFIVNNLLASGTPTNWALLGFASSVATTWNGVGTGSAAGNSLGFAIRIWPAPQQSAASGLYLIGAQTPQPLSTSATIVPSQLRDMIPVQAALAAWQDRGATNEIAMLTQIYDTRLSAWRQQMVDMGLDEQDSMEWSTFDSNYPHAGTLRPVMLTPNPLWP